MSTMLKFEVVSHFTHFWSHFSTNFHIWPTKSKLRASSTTWRCFYNVLVHARGWKMAKTWQKLPMTVFFAFFHTLTGTCVCSRTEIFGTLTEWVCLLWPDNIVRYTDSPLTILRHSLNKWHLRTYITSDITGHISFTFPLLYFGMKLQTTSNNPWTRLTINDFVSTEKSVDAAVGTYPTGMYSRLGIRFTTWINTDYLYSNTN